MKNNLIIYATAYPYTAAIITIIWVGSALLIIIDRNLSVAPVVLVNVIMTTIIAAVGFKK